MAITINTNITSLIAQKNLNSSISIMKKTMQMLTTGSKINNAGDDAAGLVISENMNAQIRGSKRAMKNVEDAKNFCAVAEGAMDNIQSHLQRINELLIQGADDSNSKDSRTAILVEIEQRLAQMEVIAKGTSFNGKTMIDGTYGEGGEAFIIQIGAYSDKAGATVVNTLDIGKSLTDCSLDELGGGIELPDNLNPDNAAYDPTGNNFRTYLDKVQTAINDISSARGLLGGYLNRIESAYDNLNSIVENLTTAKSRIQDTDVAETSSEYVKQQIMQQVSASILTQANQLPQIALGLLSN